MSELPKTSTGELMAVDHPRLVRGGALTILRVYNNGDRLKQTLPHDQAMEEIKYSKANRWGCALFIGSECVQTGCLGAERCAAISAEISSSNASLSHGDESASPTPNKS